MGRRAVPIEWAPACSRRLAPNSSEWRPLSATLGSHRSDVNFAIARLQPYCSRGILARVLNGYNDEHVKSESRIRPRCRMYLACHSGLRAC